MSKLDARVNRLESKLPKDLPNATADMLWRAFAELGLDVDEEPLPGESFHDYMSRCPPDAVYAIVRWGFHGIRP